MRNALFGIVLGSLAVFTGYEINARSVAPSVMQRPTIRNAEYNPNGKLSAGVTRVFDAENQIVCYVTSDASAFFRTRPAISCVPMSFPAPRNGQL